MTTAADISWDDLKAMIASLAESSKETDRRLRETDELIRELRESSKQSSKEADRQIKALRQELGRLGNRLGDFVEGFVEPAVVKLFRGRGLPVHQVVRRLEALDDEGNLICEVDLLVVNTDVGVAVECKSHAGVAEVREHLERLGKFKKVFPRFADLKLQGAVAAMNWTREAQRLAYKEGLWVIAQNAENVEVRNDERFKPRVW
ncbi:MAG: hypothetical protein N2690_04290 [Rhodocyclaceae bacterium]|nr:hypothetical protein [Rhodocyclaceae bacterium]